MSSNRPNSGNKSRIHQIHNKSADTTDEDPPNAMNNTQNPTVNHKHKTPYHQKPNSNQHRSFSANSQDLNEEIPVIKNRHHKINQKPNKARVNTQPSHRLLIHPRIDPQTNQITVALDDFLFDFPQNQYYPLQQTSQYAMPKRSTIQQIPDRKWVYNPSIDPNDYNDLTYTYNESILRAGLPLFPLKTSKNSLKNDENIDQSKNDFTVMSYNVLSTLHVAANEYPSTPEVLLSTMTRFPKIFSQISQLQPSIITMQEADVPYSTYVPALNTLGYQSTFKLRRNTQREISGEGLVISWKYKDWACVSQTGIEYSSYPTSTSMQKEQLCIAALLHSKHDQSKVVCIVNTHIIFNPNRINIKTAQAQMMINGVYAWLQKVRRTAGINDTSDIQIQVQTEDGQSVSMTPTELLTKIREIESAENSSISSNQYKPIRPYSKPTPETLGKDQEAYVSELLNQFDFHATGLSSVFEPVLIEYSTPLVLSNDSDKKINMQYGLRYKYRNNALYTIGSSISSGQAKSLPINLGSDDASVDGQFTKPSLIPITGEEWEGVKNVFYLPNRTVFDIFSPNSSNQQASAELCGKDYSIIDPTDLENLSPLPQHILNLQKLQSDPIYRQKSQQTINSVSNSGQTYEETEYLQPDRMLTLESIDFNNYDVLQKAMVLEYFYTNPMGKQYATREGKDLVSELNHSLLNDINEIFTDAVRAMLKRLYVEHQDPHFKVLKPTTFNDQLLFSFTFLNTHNWKRMLRKENDAGVKIQPVVTSSDLPTFTRLYLENPANGEEINLNTVESTAISLEQNKDNSQKINHSSINSILQSHLSAALGSTKHYRLPEQVVIVHRDRLPIHRAKNWGQMATHNPFHGDHINFSEINKLLSPTTWLPYYDRGAGAINAPTQSHAEKIINSPQNLQNVLTKSIFAPKSDANGVIILTGDYNANPDSDFVEFIKTAEKTNIKAHIEAKSPTFVGITLDKDAKRAFTDICFQNITYQRLCPIITSTIEQILNSSSKSNVLAQKAAYDSAGVDGLIESVECGTGECKPRRKSRKNNKNMDNSEPDQDEPFAPNSFSNFDINILKNKNKLYVYLMTHAFTDFTQSLNHANTGSDSEQLSPTQQRELDGLNQQICHAILNEMNNIYINFALKEILKTRQNIAQNAVAWRNYEKSTPDSNTPQNTQTILARLFKHTHQEQIKGISTTLQQTGFINSIYNQFIYNNKLAGDSHRRAVQSTPPNFTELVDSVYSLYATGVSISSLPGYDSAPAFLAQVYSSLTQNLIDINATVNPLFSSHQASDTAPSGGCSSYPLLSKCYANSQTIMSSIVAQANLPQKGANVPKSMPYQPALDEYPIPVNPFDTGIVLTESSTGKGGKKIQDSCRKATILGDIVSPLGPFDHPYQQNFLNNAFRLTSIQERGKCAVDHMLISQHTLKSILSSNPLELLENAKKFHKKSDYAANIAEKPMQISAVLDVLDDKEALNVNYFLPDIHEGSDHLSIMAKLGWRKL